MKNIKQLTVTTLAIGLLILAGPMQQATVADQVILDDLIIDGSECVGEDCVNGESFGFDTIRLKENNLRIRFVDTSSTASFPSRDWQITINDSANGGQNKFSIDDIDGGRTPFTLEAGAPSHSLYVDDGGRVGFGTSTPVADLHVKSGNTPTLRLEQDGSSGFTAQTWDLAGNEANFFIRDATNGSTLPFRVRPGAPSSSIDIAANGKVGIGTSSPNSNLHVKGSNAATLTVEAAGAAKLQLKNTTADLWIFNSSPTGLKIKSNAINDNLFNLENDGDLHIFKDIYAGGVLHASTSTVTVPDYVFEPEYPLMSLEDLAVFVKEKKHLPSIASAEEIKKKSYVNIMDLQMNLLKKVEELTLYTLAQEEKIRKLEKQLSKFGNNQAQKD